MKLDAGDSTGSTCSTVIAVLLSRRLSRTASEEASSSAAIPARPGLVEERALGRVPGALPADKHHGHSMTPLPLVSVRRHGPTRPQ